MSPYDRAIYQRIRSNFIKERHRLSSEIGDIYTALRVADKYDKDLHLFTKLKHKTREYDQLFENFVHLRNH